MAREGGKDKGLIEKLCHGVMKWYVRIAVKDATGKSKMAWPFGPFDTKTEARNWRDERKAEQRRGQFFPEQWRSRPAQGNRATFLGEPVHEVLAKFLRDRDRERRLGNMKPKRADDVRYVAFWTERCAGMGMRDLSRKFFTSVITQLEDDEYAPSTIYNHMQFMRRCVRLHRIEVPMVNPFEGVVIPKADAHGRVTYLDFTDEPALLRALGEYACYAMLFLWTGMRRSELILCPWDNVDLTRKYIALPDPKAGHLQYVPLTDETVALMRTMPSRFTPWVCPSISDKSKPMNPDTFSHEIWAPAVKKAGLLEKGITIHTMRHTFASRLAMQGEEDLTIATLLRHSGTGLVKRYAHLRPSHLHGVLSRLQRWSEPTGVDQSGVI